MKNHTYKSIGILFACLYWFFDSSIHKFFYGEKKFEIIPSEFNELWMRTTIFFLVIMFGFYTDYHTKKILQKEREKHKVYEATVNATYHILNNFLNKMQIFHVQAETILHFDKDKLSIYDQIIKDTAEQVKKLESITEISEEKIKDSVYPK